MIVGQGAIKGRKPDPWNWGQKKSTLKTKFQSTDIFVLERIPQKYGRPWRLVQMAMETWRKKGDDQALAQQWVKQLGTLKGVFLKAAQLTSMIPGLLPEPQRLALSQLCHQSPSMTWPFVERRLRKEWGDHALDRVLCFGKTAEFAASLGQVHRARLVCGTEVACKIQYPGMLAALEMDLKHLDQLAEMYSWFYSGLETSSLRQELCARLMMEIDYQQEARHLTWFGRFFAHHAFVSIPKVHPSLSSSTLLTMDWAQGRLFKEALTTSQEGRDRLGQQIFLAWHEPFYQAGLLHGDPHMGNLLWRDEGLTLLDFGCVGVFTPDFVGSLLDLYDALVHGQMDRLVSVYELWGFGHLSYDLIEVLNLWARFLFKPFFKDETVAFQEVACVHEGKKIVLAIHKRLCTQGQISPPGSFLLMDRVAVVLGGLLLQLNACGNWHRLLLGLFDTFNFSSCQDRQRQILQEP